MKKNRLLQKIHAQQPSFGIWLTLNDVAVVRQLSQSAFDWIAIDLEHSPLDFRDLSTYIGIIADADVAPIVRVPNVSLSWTKRVLDAGAYGIVFPMVNDLETARKAISFCRYPPMGNRSAGGNLPPLAFQCDAATYFEQANDSIAVIVQAESPQGISAAKEIAELIPVDAIFAGPLDLSFQMRHGQNGSDHPDVDSINEELARLASEVKSATTKRLSRSESRPISLGINAADRTSAKRWIEIGYQMISLGSDFDALRCGLKSVTAD